MVQSAHGTRAVNLTAQAVSGAELGLVVRSCRGWAGANQRNAKREIDRKLVIVRGIKPGKAFQQIHGTLKRVQSLCEFLTPIRAGGR